MSPRGLSLPFEGLSELVERMSLIFGQAFLLRKKGCFEPRTYSLEGSGEQLFSKSLVALSRLGYGPMALEGVALFIKLLRIYRVLGF